MLLAAAVSCGGGDESGSANVTTAGLPLGTTTSAAASGTASGGPAPTSTAGPLGATAGFKPVPLPDPGIPGYAFPEPEDKILGWVKGHDAKAIATHSWGIWTALTTVTEESFEKQKLRVFETWETPQDILAPKAVAAARKARSPRPLQRFTQFEHARASRKKGALAAEKAAGESTVVGFVKYDPTAADHAVKNDLFSKKTLQGMIDAGKTEIPAFPKTGVTLKPVFQSLGTGSAKGKPGASGSSQDSRYFQLANWPGPISPPAAFGSDAWKQCIWIDTQDLGDGPGKGAVDKTCSADGKSRTPETTYGLGRFIHFKLTASEAADTNAASEDSLSKGNIPGFKEVKEGDYSILLAMHVTSREITEWTWQTFWWVPNPDDPVFPSSKEIAAARPDKLQGAPRSYAHCTAYQMVDPNQPVKGGKNEGESVYCYNPWLEAGFDASVLPDSKPGKYKGKPVNNDVGEQTNCMSCHAQANYPGSQTSGPQYTGDRYVDLADPEFKGTLQVDFAWSIPGFAQ